MNMIATSFALIKFYAFAILYILIVMQIKLLVVVVNLNFARVALIACPPHIREVF